MPKFDLACECGARRSRILPKRPKPGDPVRNCLTCGRQMKIEVGNQSSQVIETLDNGAMSRKVERLADAERLWKDRADSDPRNK